MFVSIVQLYARYFMFPKVENALLEPSYYESLLFGSAMFSLTASLAPSVNFLGNSEEEESTEEPGDDEKKQD